MANVDALASAALSETNEIFRLAPNWVPRSFLQAGRRLKLNHYYALGMNRGGIDERWFGSTTEAANDNRGWDKGLSYCVMPNGEKFQLKEAVDELKGEIIGDEPLVGLRYFGPNAQPDAPAMGAYKNQ